jgi:hypothetical protein
MTRAEKIQAAIDALPNATGGKWLPDGRVSVCTAGGAPVRFAYKIFSPSTEDEEAEREQIAANLALASAAKELAEEVVRLRRIVAGYAPAVQPTAYHTVNGDLCRAAERGT